MATRGNGAAAGGVPLLRPFQRFLAQESAGGILLLACAVVAMIWANSPWAGAYAAFRDATITVGVGDFVLSKAALLWINDLLMAVFFFVVGLEIKRELLTGELSSPRRAALPIAAAVGGMVVPAGIYAAVNAGGPGMPGWGIPMATDIAFALGVLALMGSRAPLALKVFLAAVAIVDDLGAVMVIALFYTDQIAWGALGWGALVLVALVGLNRMGARSPVLYGVLGLLLWLAFLKSGVHATIAGVLLATTIPARRRLDEAALQTAITDLAGQYAGARRRDDEVDEADVIHTLEQVTEDAQAPLTRFEHALHPYVAFLIMPVFALANAGVVVEGSLAEAFANPVTLGIILGLFVGKQIGVTLFAWAVVKAGLAELPRGIGWRHLHGVSLLCGIGFTMSLFISGLAFSDPLLGGAAKVGILAASALSGIVGWIVLSRAPAPIPAAAPAGAAPREPAPAA